MPKLKALSGEDLIEIFGNFGFVVVGQRGSHVKLKKSAKDVAQTLTIPLYKELDRGTLRVIYRQAQRFISQEQLRGYFYS